MRRIAGLFLFLSLLVGGWAPQPAAAESFVVKDIRLEGLQRISAGTVFNYLPIKVGDTIDQTDTAEAIRVLFKTGFFKDVRVERDGSTLVISVVERPSIAEITFQGNESIETDALLDSLKQVGFAQGRPFNRSVFDQVEQELRREYFNLGKYAVKIESTVTPLERNRVSVRFDISEGRVAKIKNINIVGNEVFDDDDLLDEFKLKPSGLFTLFSSADQYSRQKLAADLETLRSYYLDRGYINFSVDSTQVSVTPDKKHVFITVNVTEGKQYTISDIKLAGDLIVPQQELFDLVTVHRGEKFSRKDVTQTSTKLTERLGKDGYAFANVNAIPEIDEENKTVALTFFVDPGKRVYVRRVNFSGNTKTRDEVLRREMRQIEGGWIDTSAVERSKVRLERLGYFEEVNVETPAVPGTTDQVDVNFNVVERPSGSLLAGVGFSQTQGIVFSTSVTQDNFLGTGNQVGLTFNNSDVNRAFGASYLNPYYTIDGVSRGFQLNYRETNAADANISDYTLDEFSGGVQFGVPVSEYNRVDLRADLEHTRFKTGVFPSREVLRFRRDNGTVFNNLVLGASFARDSRNSRVFPDRGSLDKISLETSVPGGDLTYYKVNYQHQQFFPLWKDFTLMLEGQLGYGDSFGSTEKFPLIKNFYAGGVRSVRGFKDNTLGPRDSNDEPLGGNVKVVGNAEIILPVPFITDVKSFRMTGFVDLGNVYGPDEDIDLGTLRYSTGLSVVWMSPFGAMSVSGAIPLRTEKGDETQAIQFTFGTTF